MKKSIREKPWGGRFKEPTDAKVEEFTASIQYDKRLYRYDIEGSVAHSSMLAAQGLISKKEHKAIAAALKEILAEIEEGRFEFRPADEDIHMAIEKALIEKTGDAGRKLHTARSRNDQVSLDMRLYLRKEIDDVIGHLVELKSVFLNLAKKEIKTILPGYTHMQKAQPVILSHYLLAFWEMLDRDHARLRSCRERVDVMPLGSAALAGTGLPIDRSLVSRSLGFPAVTKNSMDAVSDRDYIAEFVFDSSLIMMHLSRLCEDLIIWSTDEFRFLEMSDAFTTGSSIMPQKKNPDVAELVRGKTGRVYGNLVSLLTLIKGLPMTYNRDLQEDKEPLFDTVDTVKKCLVITIEMLRHLKFNREEMRKGAEGGFSTATDIADYLVIKGVPFRESHSIAGRIVAYAIDHGKALPELELSEFRKFHKRFGKDIYERLSLEASVNAKLHAGGTGTSAIESRIREIEGRS